MREPGTPQSPADPPPPSRLGSVLLDNAWELVLLVGLVLFGVGVSLASLPWGLALVGLVLVSLATLRIRPWAS